MYLPRCCTVKKCGKAVFILPVAEESSSQGWFRLNPGESYHYWGPGKEWYLYRAKRNGAPRLIIYQRTNGPGRLKYLVHWKQLFSIVLTIDADYQIGPNRDPRRDRQQKSLFKRKSKKKAKRTKDEKRAYKQAA